MGTSPATGFFSWGGKFSAMFAMANYTRSLKCRYVPHSIQRSSGRCGHNRTRIELYTKMNIHPVGVFFDRSRCRPYICSPLIDRRLWETGTQTFTENNVGSTRLTAIRLLDTAETVFRFCPYDFLFRFFCLCSTFSGFVIMICFFPVLSLCSHFTGFAIRSL